MTDTKSIISTLSKKWKLEQILSKKLEIENKLMEERLSQLKNQFKNEKEKRSAQGGTIWSRGQSGPMTNYAKVIKPERQNSEKESLANKLSNRQIKFQLLKDEMLSGKQESGQNNKEKDKRNKCGQCEKNVAFTRCFECGEDYCANCFTTFHMKGALQKHRTAPIGSDQSKALLNTYIYSENNNEASSRESSSRYPRDVNSQMSEYSNPKDSEFKNRFLYERSFVSSAAGDVQNEKKKDSSLMNGAYDEGEAHESFQQALMEWRNSKHNNNKTTNNSNNNKNNNNISNNNKSNNSTARNLETKDAVIGTDDQTQTVKMPQLSIKELKEQINKNRTLSYAERMLLQKHRRNDLQLSERGENEPNSNKAKTSTKEKKWDSLDLSQNDAYITFESLSNMVKEENSSQPVEAETWDMREMFDRYLESARGNPDERPIFIEEVEQSNNFNSVLNTEIKQVDVLEPELINSSVLKFESESLKRESSAKVGKSVGKSATPRPQTSSKSRLNSARTNRPGSSLSQFQSNLSRDPSDALSKISMRETKPSIELEDSRGIGDFLLLDVDNVAPPQTIQQPQQQYRPKSSLSKETLKLSHQFYEMSPRSWNPSVSVAQPSVSISQQKHDEKKDPKNIKNSVDSKVLNSSNVNNSMAKLVKEKPKTPALQAPSLAAKPKLSNETSRLSGKIKSAHTNFIDPRKNFSRNKSFVVAQSLDSKLAKKEMRNRPYSVAGSFTFSNKINMELGQEFEEYDVDDGRSSRICQNEEDESYFGQLQNELVSIEKKNVTGMKNSPKKIVQPEIDMKELNERLIKNLQSFDLSLRNDEYGSENDDLENMTLEELKSLR